MCTENEYAKKSSIKQLSLSPLKTTSGEDHFSGWCHATIATRESVTFNKHSEFLHYVLIHTTLVLAAYFRELCQCRQKLTATVAKYDFAKGRVVLRSMHYIST